MGTKWENGTRSTLCLFFEDRSVDVYVMQVGRQSIVISSLASPTSRNLADTNARHPGLQHLLPHLGHPGKLTLSLDYVSLSKYLSQDCDSEAETKISDTRRPRQTPLESGKGEVLQWATISQRVCN